MQPPVLYNHYFPHLSARLLLLSCCFDGSDVLGTPATRKPHSSLRQQVNEPVDLSYLVLAPVLILWAAM